LSELAESDFTVVSAKSFLENEFYSKPAKAPSASALASLPSVYTGVGAWYDSKCNNDGILMIPLPTASDPTTHPESSHKTDNIRPQSASSVNCTNQFWRTTYGSGIHERCPFVFIPFVCLVIPSSSITAAEKKEEQWHAIGQLDWQFHFARVLIKIIPIFSIGSANANPIACMIAAYIASIEWESEYERWIHDTFE
jgi:hypothetical protein